MGVLRGQSVVIFGLGASLGWEISPGPPLFNYINIYLYLYVPIGKGICQRPTVLRTLLYFTKVLNVKSLLGLQ